MHIRTHRRKGQSRLRPICVAKVAAVMPEIGLPCSSRALPEKFTSRRTTAVDGVVCWALSKKQSTEIVIQHKKRVSGKPHCAHLSFSILQRRK